MSTATLPTTPLSGYASADQFIATRKRMGGRWVIHIDMSVSQLVLGVDPPPVGVPQEDNREVDESRCREFATYVDENERWGSPSLMLWCPEGVLRFDPLPEINDLIPDGPQVGILNVPRNARQSIRILDGQHRIKGFHIWVDRKNAELSKAKDHLGRAREQGDPLVTNDAKHRVQKAERALARTASECIGIDLVEVDTAREAKQIFADIANHAKGMTKSLTTGFDTSKLVNRVTVDLVNDPTVTLLFNRVEWNKDRLSGNNPNFLAAKTVADVVRATFVGILGRVSRVQERTADSAAVLDSSKRFFAAITDVFPETVSEPPAELREKTLMASGTILRVLAGVWHEVTRTRTETGATVAPQMSDGEFREFLRKLRPHMNAPVRRGNPWLETGYFPSVTEDSAGVMAPSSRTQDLKGLTELIRDWALNVKPMPFR